MRLFRSKTDRELDKELDGLLTMVRQEGSRRFLGRPENAWLKDEIDRQCEGLDEWCRQYDIRRQRRIRMAKAACMALLLVGAPVAAHVICPDLRYQSAVSTGDMPHSEAADIAINQLNRIQ